MKGRRFLFLLAGSVFLLAQGGLAQKDSSGIYKTAQDFRERKLSYAINYKTEKQKIKDDFLFHENKIVVKHRGNTYTLRKDSTYGYRNTRGEVFRFIDKKDYRVLNPNEDLLIYVYQPPVLVPKEADKYSPLYFFSTDAASAPQPLTKANLKAAFPNHHKFHDALDENFKKDEELIDYDDFHKSYKLNRVYKGSVQ